MSKYIWIDPEVFNEENTGYYNKIEEKCSITLLLFKTIDEAIDFIKSIDFVEVKIIISGKLYIEFVNTFKRKITDMSIIPKIIIFTSNKKRFLEYNKEYENMDNTFYNIGGIATIVDEIIDFIKIGKNDIKQNDSIFITNNLINSNTQNNQILLNSENNSQYKSDYVQLIFEYIDCKEKLALPILFKSKIDKVSNENIEKYTNLLYNSYSEKNEDIKNLLTSIISIKNIPIEILCKFYARLFTLDSEFHKDLNQDLRLNKKEKHLPYIKTLYEGVKLQSLPLATASKLYRGSIISNNEINNIRKYLKNKIKDLPSSIVFSKSFLSFSKEPKVAKKFLDREESNENMQKVLFILEKDENLGNNLATHGDIEKISFYPKEKEVLFFPFSAFEIKSSIENKKEKRYDINLKYLGKYLKEIENIKLDKSKIPDSEFKKQLTDFGLIKKENLENINIKTLVKSFKQYEKDIEDIKIEKNKLAPKNLNQNEKNNIHNSNLENKFDNNIVLMPPSPLENSLNSNISQMNTLQRLTLEYKLCAMDNDLMQIGCNFGLVNDNIYLWRITMVGPRNTPYEDGLFTIGAWFPKDYPCHGPEFRFINKIYHLNVDFKNYPGHICLGRINEWNITGRVRDYPFYTVKQALFDIFCLFYFQGTDGAHPDQMAETYENNREKFNEEARKWTKMFASFI